jgi:hypothetical protein
MENENGKAVSSKNPLIPYDEYPNDLLKILQQAINKFCLSGDYPKKDTGEVVKWLTAKKANGVQISPTLASTMETIIAPRPYATQRTKRENKARPTPENNK